jgi:cytochrome c oxidase subunit I
MHFLGLAGMPRRIPDYAEGYADWNHLMTFGSACTFVSLVLFITIVANHLFYTRKSLVRFNTIKFIQINLF